ncbi:MAG: V-type ATPase subunit [Tissierellia bacterium]|nr:V-type ATPase subunit [Tissierellia bacterium]
MDQEKYIQSSTMTRVYEKKLLSDQSFDRLLEAPHLNEFSRILSETVYADLVQVMDSRKKIDQALDQELVKTYRDFYKLTWDEEAVEIPASKYIFHNFKVILKSQLIEEDFMGLIIPIGEYDYEAIYADIQENFVSQKAGDFTRMLNQGLEEYRKSKDPQKLDMQMDKLQYEYMLSLAKELDSKLILDYVKTLIDVQNINMTLRGKRQNHRVNCVEGFMIEGGNISADSLRRAYFDSMENIIDGLKRSLMYSHLKEALEKSLADGKLIYFKEVTSAFLNNISNRGSLYPFGPEVMFAYLLKKEREVQKLRTILIGKMNGLSGEEIKERTGELIE